MGGLFVWRRSMGDPVKTNSPAWRALKRSCYLRDKAAGAPCAICKGAYGPIDYDAAPSSHEYAYEPDHIRPRKSHPELALAADNIQPAHRRCNRAKGARAVVDSIGKPSREW